MIWRALIKAAPVRLWALILAGPPLTAVTCWLVWIVWKGPWPVGSAPQQLSILGYGLMDAMALVGVIVVALASVKVKGAGPGGVNFEVDGDQEDGK